MLGKAICKECGGTKTLEIRNKQEIWSKCLSCGFTEWEWMCGDNPEYLKQLAETYGIMENEIRKELKPKIPTEIQKTMVKQLSALTYGLNSQMLYMNDGRSLRLHIRKGKKIVNIDVIYDEGADLYNIKAYRLKDRVEKFGDEEIIIPNIDVETIAEINGVIWEELNEIIHRILKEGTRK
ncbi:MAG: hypothetical protein QXT31_03490 [Candidatus Bathyarchaeia archaeon]